MNALIPRATIEEMVAHRDRALDLYRVAFTKIAEADAAMKAATAAKESFTTEHAFYVDREAREVEAFNDAIKLPDPTEFAHVAERLTDIQFWQWIIERGELQRLMDKEAKDKLRGQLAYQPLRSRYSRDLITQDEVSRSFPPVTVENVVATIQQFTLQADTIFRRGVANAFSHLDRRFRSHDGFKIGSRVILDYFIDDYGSPSRGKVETLSDIERAFAVLDEQYGSSFMNAAYGIDQARPHGMRREAFEVMTEYFKIRVYKNGNCHLWFARDDLVDKVNLLLADYYGEVIGDGQTNDDPLRHSSTPLAKRDFDLFPTPDAVVARVIDKAALWRRPEDPPFKVLEPSAGLGNIAIAAIGQGCSVDCVEIHPDRARALRSLNGVGAIYGCDFLTLTPNLTGLYDRVLMNPPFTGERDVDAVNYALSFLKPDGRLVAIMSAGTEFRDTKKSEAFRNLMHNMHAQWTDLPPGSFSEAGTNVNTLLLCVRKDGLNVY